MRGLDAYRVYLLYSGATALFNALAFTLLTVYYVEAVHLDPLQLTLVGTALELTIFFCQVPTGVLADAFSRRWSIVLGTALIGVAYAVVGLVPVYLAVLLGQVIAGVGYAFVGGATEAWLADEVGDARVGEAFVRATQVGQIARLLGVAASVALASLAIGLPIVCGSGLTVGLAAFLWFAMPESNARARQAESPTDWRTLLRTLGQALGEVRGKPSLLAVLIALAFAGAFSEGWDRLADAHVLTNLTLPNLGTLPPVTWFGVLKGGGQIISLASTELVRRRLDLKDQRQVATALLVIQAGLVVSVAAFALGTSLPLAVVAYWSVSVLRTTGGPLLDTWLTRVADPKVRATIISLSGQADASGQIVGGPILGAIGTLASLRIAMLAAAAFLAPALAVFAGLTRLPVSTLDESDPIQL